MNKLKAIQGVVILMTSLIIAGIGAVIYGLANKKDSAEELVKTIIPNENITNSTNTIDTTTSILTLSEPRGSKISNIQTCGANLCIQVTGGATPDRIIIINSVGSPIRKITLTSEK